MEDLKMALREHADLASDLFGRFSSELRRGFAPAVDSFLGFFHAVLWKEPWLIGLLTFEVVLLLMIIITRRKMNFQLSLLILALSGVCLAETINSFSGKHWKSFAGQNYFDTHGLFISALWSGPLLFATEIILVNIIFTLCGLIVKWKRAELKHRARVSRGNQD